MHVEFRHVFYPGQYALVGDAVRHPTDAIHVLEVSFCVHSLHLQTSCGNGDILLRFLTGFGR